MKEGVFISENKLLDLSFEFAVAIVNLDDGVYFGSPNNGTDWCYIKRISDNWYYYELHWA